MKYWEKRNLGQKSSILYNGFLCSRWQKGNFYFSFYYECTAVETWEASSKKSSLLSTFPGIHVKSQSRIFSGFIFSSYSLWGIELCVNNVMTRFWSKITSPRSWLDSIKSQNIPWCRPWWSDLGHGLRHDRHPASPFVLCYLGCIFVHHALYFCEMISRERFGTVRVMIM